MRVDLFNATVSQVSSDLSLQQVGAQTATKVAAQTTAQTNQTSGEDRTTLTSDSTSVGSLVNTALNSPAIRQDKVDSLRQAIGNGQYELDSGSIAASMLDEQA